MNGKKNKRLNYQSNCTTIFNSTLTMVNVMKQKFSLCKIKYEWNELQKLHEGTLSALHTRRMMALLFLIHEHGVPFQVNIGTTNFEIVFAKRSHKQAKSFFRMIRPEEEKLNSSPEWREAKGRGGWGAEVWMGKWHLILSLSREKRSLFRIEYSIIRCYLFLKLKSQLSKFSKKSWWKLRKIQMEQ